MYEPASPTSEERATDTCGMKIRPPDIMINRGVKPSVCGKPATHDPCCSSHGKPLCCDHYNRSHFVEVNRCTPELHARVEKAAEERMKAVAASGSQAVFGDRIEGIG